MSVRSSTGTHYHVHRPSIQCVRLSRQNKCLIMSGKIATNMYQNKLVKIGSIYRYVHIQAKAIQSKFFPQGCCKISGTKNKIENHLVLHRLLLLTCKKLACGKLMTIPLFLVAADLPLMGPCLPLISPVT